MIFPFLSSSFPNVGIMGFCHGPELYKSIIFMWVLGAELKLSCLYDKDFTE